MAAKYIILLFLPLGFFHVAQSANVINIITIQAGVTVNGNVSLRASVTYCLTNPVPYRIRTSIAGVISTSVVFVVRENENELKWAIPSSDDSFRSNASLLTTEHTFVPCSQSSSSALYIDVSTVSVPPVGYTLLVEELDLYDLSISQFYDTTLKVAQPQIYYFQFPAGVAAVIVNIASNDSKTCSFVSIQSTSICPPVDTLYDAIVMGTDQTMTTSAAITITRERLGESSFYLVLIPASPLFCHGSLFSDDDDKDKYMKQIKLSVHQAETCEVSMHKTEIWLPVLIMLLSTALCGLLYFVYLKFCPCSLNCNECSCLRHIICEDISDIREKSCCYICSCRAQRDPSSYQPHNDKVKSITDFLNKTEPTITIADSSSECFKTDKVTYASYIWNTITVGIYYGIPALQVVFAKALSQQMAFPVYEEEETCYYNYQCAIALPGYVPALNNILSNSGYIIVGIVFIVIVGIRQCCYNVKGSVSNDSHLLTGNGLYYAMGLALIGEGVMSALYHVCPSDINFQFDTTFMFIIGGLIIAKLMQNRYPYFNANSFCAFWGFSVMTLLTVIGLYVDKISPVTIRVILLIFLLIIALVFYFSLYFYNQFAVILQCTMWKLRKLALLTLVIFMVLDIIVIAFMFFVARSDIATTVLTLFGLNSVLLLLLYLINKCYYSEPLVVLPIVVFILAVLFWICAAIFFRQKIYNSQATPAVSRELNKPCYIGGFYDHHDVWHFMSAAAMFTTFMVLFN